MNKECQAGKSDRPIIITVAKNDELFCIWNYCITFICNKTNPRLQISYSLLNLRKYTVDHNTQNVYNGKQCATRNDTPDLRCVKVGCAAIFALKRNEVKRKGNFFRFDAKKVFFSLVSHRCET